MTAPKTFVRRRVSAWRAARRSRVWIAGPLLGLALWLLMSGPHVPLYGQAIPMLAGIGMLVWRGPMALSMWRAAKHGEVRQASVTGRRETAITVNGRDLLRLTWCDARGASGASRPAPAENLPPAGKVIIVYMDPVTGRAWWDDDL